MLARVAVHASAPTSGKRVISPIPGAPPDPVHLPAGCCFEPRCSEKLAVCASRQPSEIEPAPSRHVSCFKYGG